MKPGNANKVRTRILSSFISVLVLGLLVLSGPAQAFELSLEVDEPIVEKGKKIVFTATLNIKAEENLLIESLFLVLDGPVKKTCEFDITGKIKSGVNEECHGINIKKIPKPRINEEYGYGYGYYGYGYNFGYGYGYTEQILEYEITLHSQKFFPGNYETSFDVLIDNKIFSKSGPEVSINSDSQGSNSGRYSGNEGEVDLDKVKVNIKTNSNVSGNIHAEEYSLLPGDVSGFSIPSLGLFFEIDADSSVINSLDEAMIKIYYTDEQVSASGIDENKLRLYYYNYDTDTWEVYDGESGGVNAGENYVWAKTNHFSLWGLFGNALPVESSNNDGGSSGRGCRTTWECSEWSDCIDGEQIRKCNKEKIYCYADIKDKPIEERICLEGLSNAQESGDKAEEQQETEAKQEEKEANQNTFSRITGAVTGTVGTAGLLVIIVFLAGIISSAIAIRIIRKRKNNY